MSSEARRTPGKSVLHSVFFPALVLAAGLMVAAPLLQPGYFWGAHDARHDAYFIMQFDRAVQDGIWFPRWAPDFTFGYGYPFWIVYGGFASFLGELLHRFLGLGFEDSAKAVIGLSIILSGFAMYGFARSWLGRNAGLVAAVAYMAVPYHLVDVFVRAAMAESVALVFLPLILWGVRESTLRPRLRSLALTAAAYAALMYTSNLVALVFTPPLLAYTAVLALWHVRDQRRAGNSGASRSRQPAALRHPLVAWIVRLAFPGAALAVGLGLSAAFFVPAIVEQNYILRSQWYGQYYDPALHFVYFHQLFNPGWGSGISQPGPNDVAMGSLSYQLGAAPLLLSLVALAIAARFSSSLRRELWFWGAWGAAAVFLTLEVSASAWQYIPLVPYAQFPWRYLMLAMLPLSILPAALAAQPNRGPDQAAAQGGANLRPAAIALVALLLVSSAPYIRVEMIEPTPEQGPVSFAALMRFQRTSDEMTGVTAWVDPENRPNWSAMAESWVRGEQVTTWVDYANVPQNQTLAVNSEWAASAAEEIWYHAGSAGQRIVFNRFWYPGWNAYLLDARGGKRIASLPVEREEGPLARVVVPVEAGEGYILLIFEDTPLRSAAKWASYVALAIAVALVVAWSPLQRWAGRRSPDRDDHRAD